MLEMLCAFSTLNMLCFSISHDVYDVVIDMFVPGLDACRASAPPVLQGPRWSAG